MFLHLKLRAGLTWPEVSVGLRSLLVQAPWYSPGGSLVDSRLASEGDFAPQGKFGKV